LEETPKAFPKNKRINITDEMIIPENHHGQGPKIKSNIVT
jgi:hypothetical protein